MKTEKEILHKIKFLEKLMKKYEKTMNKKYKMNDSRDVENFETSEELFYECMVEINALKWVLGIQ